MNSSEQHMSGPLQQRQQQQIERTRNRQTLVPRADIYETPTSLVVLADMPGVSEENVNITLEHDTLTLDGSAVVPTRPGYTLAYGEFDVADYRRSFTLATPIKRDEITATVQNGVLTLVLPKAEPAIARRIPVKAVSTGT